MTDTTGPRVEWVGTVRSSLTARDDTPCQGDEGAPPAQLIIEPAYRDACDGITVGDRIIVLTWLHLADRSVTSTRPRDDSARNPVGVFATRSPERPNPIGIHTVTVTGIDGTTITVDQLEAVNGTPVIDLKPVLGPTATR